jgi:nucleoside-diphosphate-sugar epimerase
MTIVKKKVNFFMSPKEKIQGIIYVEDLVNVFLQAMKKNKNGIYIVSNENVTINQTIKLIKKILGVYFLEIHLPVSLIRIISRLLKKNVNCIIKSRAYDCSKIRKDLGFKPKVNLEEGLKRTINWYKSVGYL